VNNKFSIFNFRLFYYLGRLFHNENPDKFEVGKNRVAVENDLRWQDDGGPAVEIPNPGDQIVDGDNFSHPNIVAGKDLSHSKF